MHLNIQADVKADIFRTKINWQDKDALTILTRQLQHLVKCPKYSIGKANSVNTDQTAPSGAV